MTQKIRTNFMRNLISVSLNKTIEVSNNIIKTGKVLKHRVWKSEDGYSVKFKGMMLRNLSEIEICEILTRI